MKVRHTKVGPFDEPEENCPKVNTGAWQESIYGRYVKIQQWRLLGSNIRFCCGGRFQIGQGWSFYYLIFMALQMLGFLFVFSWFEIGGHAKSLKDIILPSIPLIFGIFGIVSAFKLVLTDPGILPPAIYDPEREKLILQHLEKNFNPKALVYDKMIPDRIDVDGELVERFYCTECRAYREFRTFHCPICKVCIDRYDHHCVLLGMCVGRRNYGYFLKFVWSTTFSLLGIVICSMINLVTISIEEGFLIATTKSPTCFVLIAGLICPPCGSAYMFYIAYSHFCLVWSNRTLKEKNNGIPGLAIPFKYHESYWQAFSERISNLGTILCNKLPPPHIHPENYVCVKAIPRDAPNGAINANSAEDSGWVDSSLDTNSDIQDDNNSITKRSKKVQVHRKGKIQGQSVLIKGPVKLKRVGRPRHVWKDKPNGRERFRREQHQILLAGLYQNDSTFPISELGHNNNNIL